MRFKETQTNIRSVLKEVLLPFNVLMAYRAQMHAQDISLHRKFCYIPSLFTSVHHDLLPFYVNFPSSYPQLLNQTQD